LSAWRTRARGCPGNGRRPDAMSDRRPDSIAVNEQSRALGLGTGHAEGAGHAASSPIRSTRLHGRAHHAGHRRSLPPQAKCRAQRTHPRDPWSCAGALPHLASCVRVPVDPLARARDRVPRRAPGGVPPVRERQRGEGGTGGPRLEWEGMGPSHAGHPRRRRRGRRGSSALHPGARCEGGSRRELALGDALVGVWQDRAREARMRRRGPAPRDAVLRRYPIDLVPLPSWSDTTREVRQATVQRMLADIERDARQAHPVVLGADAVQAQDPVTRLQAPASSPAPPVHGMDQETRRSFIAARRLFVAAYRAATVASAALAMSLATRYPAGAFPSRPAPAPPPGHPATATMVQPREVWHPPSLDRAPHAELARRGAASDREVPWSRT
jgi:hypothetical protein